MASSDQKTNIQNDSNTQSPPLIDKVLGVHCACYDMLTVKDKPYCVDIPIGPHIARWDIQKQERINTFKLHTAVISSIQSYNDSTNYFIATCGYDCMLKIWDKDYNLLCETMASDSSPVARIDWSIDGKQLLIQIKSTESTYNDCILSVYNLIKNNNNKYSLTLSNKKKGNYRYGLFNEYNQVLAFNTSPNIIELLAKDTMKFIASYTDAINNEWACGISINKLRNTLAIATTTKHILIIDPVTLETINIIKHNDLSPQLWCILWNNNNEIIFQPKNGQLEIWDVKSDKYKYKTLSPYDFMYCIIKSNYNDNYVWFFGSDSIYLQCIAPPIVSKTIVSDDNTTNIDQKSNEMDNKLYIENINKSRLTLQYHTITCCGVDLSFNNNGKCEYIAVGDLGCKLCIWPTESNSYKPLISKLCPMSVRSIKWIPRTDIIFIGCLDGSLSCYKFNKNDPNNNELLSVIYNCQTGITCIQYQKQYAATCNDYQSFNNNNNNDIIICVGTLGGDIFILNYNNINNTIVLLNRFIAHPPVHSNDPQYKERYGSIHKAADIWTCIWSPCTKYIATASEDQSTKIWTFDNHYKQQKHLKTLTGHDSAVTSIDWTYLNNNKNEIFATCADDRTIMIWKPIKWELLYRFSPSNVLGWFTFTYLRFIRDSDKLICGTENGYVCVFNIDENNINSGGMKQLNTKCLHRGSVEGFEANKNGLAVSIASDCTIVIQNINNKTLNIKNDNDNTQSLL